MDPIRRLARTDWNSKFPIICFLFGAGIIGTE